MASLFLTTSLIPNCSHAKAIVTKNPWRPGARRTLQISSRQEASGACDKAAEAGKDGANAIKTEASTAAEKAAQKTKDCAQKVSETAEDITDKAKQTVQDAWGSVKDTTQKIKDTVVGKAEESTESVKEGAKSSIKRNISA